jgi:diguanylate cyclase (GGDEF)-like protein
MVSFLPSPGAITELLESESREFAVLGLDPSGRVLSAGGVDLPGVLLKTSALEGESLFDVWQAVDPLRDFLGRALKGPAASSTFLAPGLAPDSPPRLFRLFSAPLPAGGEWALILFAFLVPLSVDSTARNNRLMVHLTHLALGDVSIKVLIEQALELLRDYSRLEFIHFLALEGEHKLTLVKSVGWQPEEVASIRRKQWTGSLELEACTSKTNVYVKDLSTPVRKGAAGAIQATGVLSGAAFPVGVGSGVFGVLSVYSSVKSGFTSEDLNLLQSVVNILSQAAQRRSDQQRVRKAAECDPLTGVLNRGAFVEELDREVRAAVARGTFGAVLFIDLDDFKSINDSQGHLAGDLYLIDIAKTVAGNLRASDVLGRLGGDEFAVLLKRSDARRAYAIAQRILDSIRSLRVAVDGQDLSCTASIGVASFPEHASTGPGLIRLADSAMYRVKQRGRDGVFVYAAPRAKSTPRRRVA